MLVAMLTESILLTFVKSANNLIITIIKLYTRLVIFQTNLINITKGINSSNDQHQILMTICSQFISRLKKEQESLLEKNFRPIRELTQRNKKERVVMQKDQKKCQQIKESRKQPNINQNKNIKSQRTKKTKSKNINSKQVKRYSSQIQTIQKEVQIQFDFKKNVQNFNTLYSSVKNMKNTTKTNGTSKKSREKSNEKCCSKINSK